jgi:hypothetical protein
MFALLIVDDGGTGKGWIGYMLRVLFGDQNVAMIESDDPVKDMFNGWTLTRARGAATTSTVSVALAECAISVNSQSCMQFGGNTR